MDGYVLLLGGARSGKSRLAATLAERAGGPVTVVATAEAGDEEMAARIAAHRAERSASWTVVEEPLRVAEAIEGAAGVVVLDCVTLWVTNLVLAGRSDGEVLEAVRQVAELLATRAGGGVVVSNEVGSGAVPLTPLGRRFQDLLGAANTLLAARATQALLLVAGMAVPLVPLGDLLPGPGRETGR